VTEQLPDYAINLRRLFAWHLHSNKDVAELLGTTEHTVGHWTNGRHEPSGKYLRAIAENYAVDAVRLFGDPIVFGDDISSHMRWRELAENAEQRRAQLRVVKHE